MAVSLLLNPISLSSASSSNGATTSSSSSYLQWISSTLRFSSSHPSNSSLFCNLRHSARWKSKNHVIRGSITTESSPAASTSKYGEGTSKVILEVKDLTAAVTEKKGKYMGDVSKKKQILNGVNLVIREGEVHAIMGRNGSGKSTFANVLVGHPDIDVTGGVVVFKGENLLDMEPEERSHAGLFMSFQYPVEIPGVTNIEFLRMAYNARMVKRGQKELEPLEFYGFLYPKIQALKMDVKFLDRNVNEGFSGGEKKRNEILQLAVLEAELAILDEIDSGLDVDALQDVASAVNGLLTPRNSILMITHYKRLLDYIKPVFIHIMEDGRIVKTGDISLAKQLEEEGYKFISVS